MRSLQAFIIAIIAISAFTANPASAQTYPGKIGVNIEGVNAWMRDFMFVDAMQSSRPWDNIGDWGNYGSAAMDTQGWPTTDAEVEVFDMRANNATQDSAPVFPNMAGTYHLSFTGQATVAPDTSGGCAFTVSGQVYNSTTNVTTADIIVPAGQQLLNIEFTNTKRTAASGTNTGVTKVKLIRPGYAANTTQEFTTVFLNSLTDFSTLRVMDWLGTNINVPTYPATTAWADRRLKTDATQINGVQNPPIIPGTRIGGAWEYAIDVANQTNKDLWINVPSAATDDYITKLAQLFKYGSDGVTPYTSTQANPVCPPLNPSLHVYVEYSNEVWNSATIGYPYHYNDDWSQAQAALLGGPYPTTTTNRYDMQRRLYGKRAVEISNIFKTVFGAAAINTTIRPVLAWQAIDAGAMDTVLQFISSYYGVAPNTLFYALSEATYYGNSDNTTDVTTLLNEMTASSDSEKVYVGYYSSRAAQYNMKLICYEGGPGLWGDIAAYYTANRDPRMTTLITHDVNNVFSQGVSLYMFFQQSGPYNQFGYWGLTEDINNLNTAKWQAMDQLVGRAAYPTNLTATAANGQVVLNWTAGQGATSYNVKRSTTNGSGYANVATNVTATTSTDSTVTNLTTYYYVVTSVSAGGESVPSNQAFATPSGSGGVSINVGGGAASPFVTDSDYSGGAQASNYTGAVDTTAVTNPAPQAVYQSERYGTFSYTVPGLTASASYTVRLHFTEDYHTGAGQRIENVTINGTQVLTNYDIYAAAGAIHKANIQQFTATANANGQIVISFAATASSPDTNAKVDGIEVISTISNTHGGTWSDRGIITTTPAWKSTWQVASGVVPNSTYTASFWVKGSGGVILIVDAGNWGAELKRQTFIATSTWTLCSFTIPTGANTQLTYVVTDGSGVAGTLYVDDCFLGVLSGANVLANPGFESGVTGWQVDSGSPWTILQPGGNAGDTTPPTAPSGLTSPSQTTSSVNLSWTASTDNVGVTGYNVYNGATLAATVTGTTATVSGLAANTAYSFTVKAFDAANNISAASSALNISTLSANTHAGTWSLKGVPTGTPGWRNVWQVASCATNSTYTASFWLKGSGGVSLYIYNGSWGTQNTVQTFTATSTWTLKSFTVSTGSNTQLTYALSDATSTAGTLYIDDCFLGAGTNTLANPGFESGAVTWNVDVPSVWTIVQNP